MYTCVVFIQVTIQTCIQTSLPICVYPLPRLPNVIRRSKLRQLYGLLVISWISFAVDALLFTLPIHLYYSLLPKANASSFSALTAATVIGYRHKKCSVA